MTRFLPSICAVFALGSAHMAAACGLTQNTHLCIDPTDFGLVPDSMAFGASLAFARTDGANLSLVVGAPDTDARGRVFVATVRRPFGTVVLLPTTHVGKNDLPRLGSAQRGDRFGASLASGDFDGDGFDDIAVGAPGDAESGLIARGALFAIPGSHLGLAPGAAIGRDDFAAELQIRDGAMALAVFDHDGDGDDDLYVGSRRRTISPGLVSVLEGFHVHRYAGSAVGLSASFDREFLNPASHWGLRSDASVALTVGRGELRGVLIGEPWADDGSARQNGAVLRMFDSGYPLGVLLSTPATPRDDGHFGSALAVGDFDGDGRYELAVGEPGVEVDGAARAGQVTIDRQQQAPGLRQQLSEASFPDRIAQRNHRFGAALVVADFDRDGFDDLVVGAPGEGDGELGALFAFMGSPDGLKPLVGLTEAAVGGARVRGHRFGSVLAAHDVDGDRKPELVAGVPAFKIAGQPAGRVYISRVLQP